MNTTDEVHTVYKIVADGDVNTIYIGSTVKDLPDRFADHKWKARHLNNKKHEWLKANIDVASIHEICKASNKAEALQLEEAKVKECLMQGLNVVNIKWPTTGKTINTQEAF